MRRTMQSGTIRIGAGVLAWALSAPERGCLYPASRGGCAGQTDYD